MYTVAGVDMSAKGYPMKTFYKCTDSGVAELEKLADGTWVHVQEPTGEERDFLEQTMGVPKAFYNDIEDVDERPRIEVEDGWTLIILRIPAKSDPMLPFSTVPLGIVFNEKHFVTITHSPTEVVADFVQYTRRKSVQISNFVDLVLRLHLSSSVWHMKYLKQIQQKIRQAERLLESSVRNEDLHELFQLEKCLVYFTTSLKTNDILATRLRMYKPFKEIYDEDLMEDVEIEVRQAMDMTAIYSSILSGMMRSYESVISNNLNSVMKRLTSISILLMIPTLVASFFGMNVPNFMEQNTFAFVAIVVLSTLFSVISAYFFTIRKWL